MTADTPLPPHMDAARFDALIDSVGPDSLLVVIASSMGAHVRAWCDPEDVWQETLALAWRDRAQHRWETPEAYRTWLVTIARNRIRDIARSLGTVKRGAKRTGLFGDIDGGKSAPFEAYLPAGSTTPSRVAHHSERARRMSDALATLGDDDREFLTAHLFEERTMESIAAERSISLSAAWRRFRKASETYAAALAGFDSRSEPPRGTP
ncbi:MAG: sigma-70 family RNA polymerase sigma factor [Planctomycetes bacterium]|nr:sigma-70 family RNA polymerase sigma factor [Planctomycetota bacterium]